MAVTEVLGVSIASAVSTRQSRREVDVEEWQHKCWNPLPLEKIFTSVSIRGFVARINATLHYYNKFSDVLEVLFQLPVDESSALYRVEAKFADRTLTATCLEKKRAEKVYKDAVKAGHSAVLVREDSRTADIISLALGNLPAESHAEVTLSFVCDLRVSTDGGVQFTLPTVLNPRYNPADGPEPDVHHVVGDEGLICSVDAPYEIYLSAEVIGAQSISRIVSHSDVIDVQISDENTHAKVAFNEDKFKSDHDASFVVYYEKPYEPHVLLESGDSTETGLMKDQVLMINLFPEITNESYSRFNEVIFIIDRSGSMHGEDIQSARAVLQLFLKSLPPGCLFNVISFGSSHSLLFPEGSRPYSKETLDQALGLHAKMDADMGGTEVLAPLKTVYDKPTDPEYARQILLITDGAVWNVDQVTSLASRFAHNTRVFTVGIGEGASTALVKGLAQAGGGRAEMVTQKDRMQTKVMGLVASMLQSTVRNVDVSCELEPQTRLHLVPPAPPVIFGGQHLVTYARIPPGTNVKSLQLKGNIDGHAWSASISASQVKVVHDESRALHRLAARAQIRHAYIHESEATPEDIVALSVSSGVLSRYTAFVAIDQDKTIIKVKRSKERDENSLSSRGLAMPLMKVKKKAFAYFNKPMAMPGGYGAAPQPKSFRSREFRSAAHTARSLDFNTVECCEAEEGGSSLMNTECLDPKEALFAGLIEEQNFDGSWGSTFISKMFACEVNEIMIEGYEESVIATGLALYLLENCYPDRKQEWQFLAQKSKTFLISKLSGESVEKFLAKFKDVFDKMKVTHNYLG